MKTLKTIKALAKAGKIISKIIFVCSLVGAILCGVGLATAWLPQVMKLGDVTVHGVVDREMSISLGQIYAALSAGVIFCVTEATLAKISENFFKFALDKGTPFDFEVAKKLMDLGIKIIWMPLVATIIASIFYGIISYCTKGESYYDFEGFSQLGLGIGFIITSLLCKAGAETNDTKEETPETQE